MSHKAILGPVGLCAASAILMGSPAASAHTIVGNRVFPATLTVDDPGVNDELTLPVFSYLPAANPDGTAGPVAYTLGGEYAKTITADLQVSIGSDGVTFSKESTRDGVHEHRGRDEIRLLPEPGPRIHRVRRGSMSRSAARAVRRHRRFPRISIRPSRPVCMSAGVSAMLPWIGCGPSPSRAR